MSENDLLKEKPDSSNSDSSPSMHHLDDEFYRDTRKSFAYALLDQSRSFDKYVLTLAAGSFGLSLIFINNLAPNPIPGSKIFLILAWCSFGVSILCTLLSFLFSQHACLKEIDVIDEILFSPECKQSASNTFSKITMVSNWVSMVFFVIGVVLLIVFSTQNLLSKGVS